MSSSKLYEEVPLLRDFVDFRFDNPRVAFALLELDAADGPERLSDRQRERFLAELNSRILGTTAEDLTAARLGELLDPVQRARLGRRTGPAEEGSRAPLEAGALRRMLERLAELAGEAPPEAVPERGTGGPFHDLRQALEGLLALADAPGPSRLRPGQAAAALQILTVVQEHEIDNTPPLTPDQEFWVAEREHASLDLEDLLQREGFADERAAGEILRQRLRQALKSSLGLRDPGEPGSSRGPAGVRPGRPTRGGTHAG